MIAKLKVATILALTVNAYLAKHLNKFTVERKKIDLKKKLWNVIDY